MNAKPMVRPTWFLSLAWCLAIAGTLAPTAVRAEVHGGIEIGGKGVKATVVEVSGEGADIRIKVKLSDTTNTALVAGVAKKGRFEATALAETVRAVRKYYNRLRKEFSVAPKRIYVVGSSGLFAPISDKPDLIKENQQTLARAVKEEMGRPLTFIDVQREAELSIVGTLPKSRRKTGVLVDIGGGNTKGGCLVEGKLATFGVPFGTVTFSELARKRKANDAKSLSQLCDKAVTPLLKQKLSRLPDIAKRDRIYLSGGVVWAVTTFAHPTARTNYTGLTLADVERVEARLAAHPTAFPAPDLSAVTDKKLRQRALAEVARVKKVYRPEQLLAGTQILKSVFRELGDRKQFFFARNGYLGWILAYVTESAGEAK
jgi:exopolyphosphatase/pppGpp-phosphohydrolase